MDSCSCRKDIVEVRSGPKLTLLLCVKRRLGPKHICCKSDTAPRGRVLRPYKNARTHNPEVANERSAKPQLKNAISGQSYLLGLHYIVLQYILIASLASPGKLRADSLFTPPLQRLKHLWLPCAFFCSAPTVWYGMIHVNATANHSCTNQVWIQLSGEVWMSSHSDMLHAFHSLPSVWVANHQHGPMLLPWLSSSRRKIAKPDLQVQVCRCARDEPGLTKAMERCKRICIAAKRSP